MKCEEGHRLRQAQHLGHEGRALVLVAAPDDRVIELGGHGVLSVSPGPVRRAGSTGGTAAHRRRSALTGSSAEQMRAPVP